MNFVTTTFAVIIAAAMAGLFWLAMLFLSHWIGWAMIGAIFAALVLAGTARGAIRALGDRRRA
jgi:hypothetical protein